MLFTRILEKIFRLAPIEPSICQSCEHLKLLLEQERLERRELIKLATKIPEAQPRSEFPKDFQSLPSRHTPFSVKRAQLEQADRLLAEQRRADAKAKANAGTETRIQELEKELGVEEKENAG